MATTDFRFFEMPIFVPQPATTLAGFRAWALSQEYPEQGQISFTQGGLLIDMSPEQFETHNQVKIEVTSVLQQFVKQQDLGRVFADRFLLTNEIAEFSTEPDGMFVSWDSFSSGKVRWSESDIGDFAELIGTPDWVLEIVSPSSRKKDTEILLQAYHRAGIPEYWLIDALGEAIDFKVLVREQDAYRRVEADDGWHASPTFGRAFRLDRERDRLGLWRYSLTAR